MLQNHLKYNQDCSPLLHYRSAYRANSCGNAITKPPALLHTGKERDSETGLSYFGARYYDSDILTSWLSVDPMADKYPNMSPYAYCGWNPVRLVDPDGREIWIVGDDGSTITYTPTMLSKNISGFSQQVIDGLNNIYNSCEEGKDLINQLSSSQHVFTIKKIEKGRSSFTPDSPSESYCLNKKEVVTNLKEWFESGKGIGSSGTILWNTNGYNILTTEGIRNDPVYHLLHELSHAFDSNNGLMSAKETEKGKLSPDEWSACYKSNSIAPFMGFPLQSYYGGECDIYGNYIGGGTRVLDENNKPYICYE